MVEKVLKKIVKKTEAKAVKVPVLKVKKINELKVVKTAKAENLLEVAVFDNTGKENGSVTLPGSVFGVKINKTLMAQAVRVYLANQRMGAAVTKTRGQVDGSTRKIYQQKGTGRARHGGIRAPIFVGGGTAHGPKSRDYSLNLSQQMKRAAVLSALSEIATEGQVKVVVGLTELAPKTQLTAKVLAGMGLMNKKVLLVMPSHIENVFKAVRNIEKVAVAPVSQLTTYDVLNAGVLVIMQEALGVLEKQFKKENK